MDQVFSFIALLVGSHLIVGSAIVLLAALSLRSLKTNAATRHNVWLGVLVLLVFMPGLALFSATGPAPSASFVMQESDSSSTKQTLLSQGELTLLQREQGARTSSAPSPLVAAVQHSRFEIITAPISALLLTLRSILSQLPWHWLGAAFSLVVAVGIVLRMSMFLRSYQKLNSLFNRSLSVENSGQKLLARLVVQIGISEPPLLTHSEEVRTPLTSGIMRRWIMLPSELVQPSLPTRELEPILLHELAHIRRRDPLIASLQAFISVFFFWHPAVYFVNRQIRFERELAADDWVLALGKRDDRRHAQSYARSLLGIAQALRSRVATTHSVACVHSSQGLRARIRILLDKKTNHSTTPQKLYSAGLSSALAVVLVTTAPMWPTVPKLQRVDADSVEAAVSADGEEFSEGLTEVSAVAIEDNFSVAATVGLASDQSARGFSVPRESTAHPETVSPPQSEASHSDSTEVTGSELVDGIVFGDAAVLDQDRGLNEEERQSVELIRDLRNSSVGESIAVLADIAPIESNPEPSIETPDLPVRAAPDPMLSSYEINESTTRETLASVEETLHGSEAGNPEPLNFVTALLSSAQLAANSTNAMPAREVKQSSQLTSNDSEVIVIDDLSRGELLREIVKIEDEYFRIFNASTQHKDLRVECGEYLPTASYIYQRYCEPMFVIAARSEDIYLSFMHDFYPRTSQGLVPDMTEQFEQFASETNSLIRENSYFRDLNRTLRLLKGRLQEMS